MKLNILFILIFFVFVNNQVNGAITYRAKNVETLVIFSFGAKPNETDSQKIDLYIDYFTDLVNIWDVDRNIFDLDIIPLQLFFGDYNATELLNAADDENTTIATIVLKNNQEFIDNVTIEANDTSLTSKTACNETHDLCKVINDFLKLERDLLTKLNLVVFTNICPDQSIFEEFHKYDSEIKTETFLVTTAVGPNQQSCGISNSILTEQFIPKDWNNVEDNDRDKLINPTFAREVNKVENYLILFVKKGNYDASLKFIADYYNDTTNCEYLESPAKEERDKLYLITMRRTEDDGSFKDITTLIPRVDFTAAKFSFEEYLQYNMNYKFNNPGDDKNDIDRYISNYNPDNIIIFTDNYDNIQKYDNSYFAAENRTVDYILYLTSPNDTIVKNVEQKFYREENNQNFKAAFHILTKTGPPGNAFGENICRRLKKATPFELLWWHWALIGLGIVILLIGLFAFYHKFIRRPNLYVEILKDVSPENREEFSKANDRLYIKEGRFKINFNSVKGYGVSSTVYEATISRLLLSSLTRKSFDNSTSEDCIVAAKVLNQFEQEQKDAVIGEIDAARMLEKHDKICTLLGWSSHMGAPCLLFELMEQDLRSYIMALRVPLSSFESERGSVITLSVAESEQYIVPDFDERQQKIFLQILWQASQGMEYIASKNIVHRDVAARNLLISQYGDSNTYTAKIADFGLCVTVDETTKEYHRVSQSKRLPIKLFAPECHFEKVFSEASDVWAFGLLMVEVYSLSGPLYPGIKLDELPEYLKNGGRMEKPEKMPSDIYDLAFNCWKDDPNLRKPFYKLSKELKEKLRSLDPENDAYRDYWHLKIEDEELMESFIPRKLKTK